MNGYGPNIEKSWWLFAAVLTVGWAALAGCDRSPAPAVEEGDDDAGLEEGAIVDRTVYTFRSPSVFDPPEISQVPHQVVNGQLVPLSEVGQEPPPMGTIRVAYDDAMPSRSRDHTPAEYGSEVVVEDLMEIGNVSVGPKALEFLKSAPTESRATTRTAIHVTERLAAVDYLSDLGTHGIEFQFRQVEPPPTGATEVVEFILDGKTRGAIEQFDDPAALATWYKANVQMMQDLGMDPDEHMVLRGMTLVRLGKTGHAGAMNRARETRLVDESLGYLAVARRAAEAQPRFDAGPRIPGDSYYHDKEITLLPMQGGDVELIPMEDLGEVSQDGDENLP